MKKTTFLTALLLMSAVSTAAFAERNRDNHGQDNYRNDKHYSSNQRNHSSSNYDRRDGKGDHHESGRHHNRYTQHYGKHYDKYYNGRHYDRNRGGYRRDHHQRHQGYRRHGRHGRHVVYRDNHHDYYKWIGGAFLLNEILHHNHH